MARYVNVCALGPSALAADPGLADAEILRRMRAHWRQHIERALPGEPDLIVLHETCDRPQGLSVPRRLAYYAERGEMIREDMAKLAREGRCNIAYSAVRQMPDGTWRNMTELIDREGRGVGCYSKNHVVPHEYEEAGILYGQAPKLIQLDIGTVAPTICFDLNYTELLTQIAAMQPDMILFSSMYHGGLMQPYWAYTARAYFIGAVCGLPCTVLSPVGKTLAESTNYYPRVAARINLDCAVVHLDNNWERFEAARDKYGPGFQVDDPGFVGAVLARCERDDMTIHDMLGEFGIITLDAYLANCRAHRRLPGRIEA